MCNVISFPAGECQQVKTKNRNPRPMTLFLHVKCATLIVHLADNRPMVAAERMGKS